MKTIWGMVDNFSEKPRLFPDFGGKKTPKERRLARLALLFVFGFTILFTGLAISYRELPRFLRRLNEPTTVVSRKFSQPAPTATPTPKLEKERQAVEQIIEPLRGTYGIYFRDLEKGDAFSINGQEKMTAASLIKMPTLLTLYREADAGRLNLDTVYKLQAADKRGGSGSLVGRPVDFEISYREMAKLMGEQSDNTAFNIIANKILGGEKIQNTINLLGMRQTSFNDNLTSPEDMGLLFRKLLQEKVVSDKGKDEILSFITNTIWETRIPAGIPKGIRVSHKIGSEIGVISDAGIVFAKKPFILVIMSQNANEIEAGKALPEIAKKIYEMWEQ